MHTQNLIVVDSRLIIELQRFIAQGYHNIRVGFISPKRKGVIITNDDDQVCGVYPLKNLEMITNLVNYIKSNPNFKPF